MRHVAAARVELGTRTLFNLIGPLSNPAGVDRQLLGVPSAAWLDPLTEGLRVFSRRITEDPRLHSVILTVGDGLSVSWVKLEEG